LQFAWRDAYELHGKLEQVVDEALAARATPAVSGHVEGEDEGVVDLPS
jgi:hypothetical protein